MLRRVCLGLLQMHLNCAVSFSALKVLVSNAENLQHLSRGGGHNGHSREAVHEDDDLLKVSTDQSPSKCKLLTAVMALVAARDPVEL